MAVAPPIPSAIELAPVVLGYLLMDAAAKPAWRDSRRPRLYECQLKRDVSKQPEQPNSS